jgi:pimeloyl-ACP methyl ester carboxylesterase
MASVETNGITVEYFEQGEGEPLLLVMGLGGQLIDWPQGLVDEFVSRGFRVISFDNRDSGLSTEFRSHPPTKAELARTVLLRRPLRSEYTLSDMASDAVGLLDALEIDTAHVVGMSMGGMIAQLIAIEHPERVRTLTSIMSTTGPYVGRPKWAVIRKMLRREEATIENAIEVAVEAFRDVCGPTFDPDEFRVLAKASIDRSFRPVGTQRQLAAVIASPDRTEQLRKLRMPALVIHGMVDPLVRPSGGYATARAIPGSRLVLFNDMGHDLPRTRWSEIADEVASLAAKAPHTNRQQPQPTPA